MEVDTSSQLTPGFRAKQNSYPEKGIVDGTLSRLLQSLTIDEQAEVETFAMFILARRKLHKLQIATEDISAEELMQLVADSGSFDWLDAPEEDVYSVEDGQTIQWSAR